jgi:hypothetical protein
MITAPFRRLAGVNGRLLAILRAAELNRRLNAPDFKLWCAVA